MSSDGEVVEVAMERQQSCSETEGEIIDGGAVTDLDADGLSFNPGRHREKTASVVAIILLAIFGIISAGQSSSLLL
jgi:hypothetical protein